MSNSNSVPRIIRRNSITVVIRDQSYEIHGLSIAGLERFKKGINSLISKVFQHIGELPKLNWTPQAAENKGILAKVFKQNKPAKYKMPVETIEFINGLLDSVLKEPLELLEAVSGLPHELFDPNQKEKCLSIEEIKELVEVVFEVNGLGFIWTALKNWGSQLVKSTQMKSSVPSASGTDIPLMN